MNEPVPPRTSPFRILLASMIGTTIEFFDFYIYATAAVLVFPHLFFPASDPTSSLLQSFATFSIAFFARPIGAALFGHFGDRIGRKTTLVASLLLMGTSTVLIGLLPTYETIGVWAALLLALCRFGQGLGLGGEWGGAVLLATENAPPGKRSWYGMFPQLGAPAGFILATGSFLLLSEMLSEDQFFSFGWRLPFLASIILIILGLLIRLHLAETPAFRKAIENAERVRVPLVALVRDHRASLFLGTFAALATFVLFYIMTVFSLSWGTQNLGYGREEFLALQMMGVVFFALTMPAATFLADRFGLRPVMVGTTVAIAIFGLVAGSLLAGSTSGIVVFLIVGFGLMGFTYGPLGAALASPFPTSVRYSGASMTFNFAGILGASLAPYIATWLAATYGVSWVGYYITLSAVITAAAFTFLAMRSDHV